MRKLALLLSLLVLLLAACQSPEKPAATNDASTATPVGHSLTVSPTWAATSTPSSPTPTISAAFTKTGSPTITPTKTVTPFPTYPPETKVRLQCLEVAPEFVADTFSKGVVVMDSRKITNGRYEPITQLLNTKTRESIDITYGYNYVITADKTLMAYDQGTAIEQGKLVKQNLIITNASGQRVSTIPWEEKWQRILGWTNDQRLLLSYDEPITTTDGYSAQVSYLVFDPFSGDQQIIAPNYPRLLDLTSAWDWSGRSVVYDPALTRAVYAWQYLDGDEEMYTLGLWDMEKQRLVATMEAYYVYYPVFKIETPLPRWAQDGSKFAFRGQFLASRSDERVTIELYQADRDGQVEQLTHLGLTTNSVPSRSFTWSPDGRYIAMYLEDWSATPNVRVALLDTVTQEVTDYCIPVGRKPSAPVWSPDSTQFLVVDRSEEEQSRVILVDIVQDFAAVIAKDMEPVGWMLPPAP